VVEIYPWALGSHSVASYDSQGYGRGVNIELVLIVQYISLTFDVTKAYSGKEKISFVDFLMCSALKYVNKTCIQ
jgi:hypothetical protein